MLSVGVLRVNAKDPHHYYVQIQVLSNKALSGVLTAGSNSDQLARTDTCQTSSRTPQFNTSSFTVRPPQPLSDCRPDQPLLRVDLLAAEATHQPQGEATEAGGPSAADSSAGELVGCGLLRCPTAPQLREQLLNGQPLRQTVRLLGVAVAGARSLAGGGADAGGNAAGEVELEVALVKEDGDRKVDAGQPSTARGVHFQNNDPLGNTATAGAGVGAVTPSESKPATESPLSRVSRPPPADSDEPLAPSVSASLPSPLQQPVPVVTEAAGVVLPGPTSSGGAAGSGGGGGSSDGGGHDVAVLMAGSARQQAAISALTRQLEAATSRVTTLEERLGEEEAQARGLAEDNVRLQQLLLQEKQAWRLPQFQALASSSTLSREELLERCESALAAYGRERQRNGELVERLRQLHSEQVDTLELKKRYQELQDAHMQQTRLLATLEGQAATEGGGAQLRSTVGMQEEIIRNLEKLLKQAVQAAKPGPPKESQNSTQHQHLEKLKEMEAEEDRLRKQLAAAQDAVRQLEAQLAAATTAAADREAAAAERVRQLEEEVVMGGAQADAAWQREAAVAERVRQLEGELAEAAANVGVQSEEVTTLQDQVRQLQTELAGATEAREAATQAETEAQERVRQMEGQLAEAAAAAVDGSEEGGKQVDRITELEGALAQAEEARRLAEEREAETRERLRQSTEGQTAPAAGVTATASAELSAEADPEAGGAAEESSEPPPGPSPAPPQAPEESRGEAEKQARAVATEGGEGSASENDSKAAAEEEERIRQLESELASALAQVEELRKQLAAQDMKEGAPAPQEAKEEQGPTQQREETKEGDKAPESGEEEQKQQEQEAAAKEENEEGSADTSAERLKQLEGELAAAEKQAEVLQKQQEEAEGRVGELEGQLEAAQTSAERVRQLEEEVVMAGAQADAARQREAAAAERVRQLEEELAEAKKELEALRKQEDAAATNGQDTAGREKEKEAGQQQREQEQEEAVKRLEGEVVALTEERTAAQLRADYAESAAEAAREQLMDVTKRFAREIAELKARLSEKEALLAGGGGSAGLLGGGGGGLFPGAPTRPPGPAGPGHSGSFRQGGQLGAGSARQGSAGTGSNGAAGGGGAGGGGGSRGGSRGVTGSHGPAGGSPPPPTGSGGGLLPPLKP